MATRKQVEEAAAEVGLYVDYYNPGDGAWWRFTARPLEFFAASDAEVLGRIRGPASAAMLWLSGYAAGRMIARGGRVNVEMVRRRARDVGGATERAHRGRDE